MDTLTHEQLTVLYELVKGNNIGLLGAAGCGKSYLLSIICNELPGIRQRLDPGNDMCRCNIQVCALTGCAALLLGNKAKTLHSWAGIGIGKGTVDELVQKIRKNTKARRNWTSTDILIIDEVSMLTAELLDKLNAIAQLIRKNTNPFGGIQLLLVGDFYQLPPVIKSANAQEQYEVNGVKTVFAFESETWSKLIHICIELTIIQRQKDPIFQQIVKEARIGQLSKESGAIIKGCMGRDWQNQKIRPTLIFPRRAEVDMINDSNLKALVEASPLHTYKAKLLYDDAKLGKHFSEKDEQFQRTLLYMDNEAAYAVELELVLNAQVMLIANIDSSIGLVNGSRGVIVGFCPSTDFPMVEFINGIRKPIGLHTWSIDGYEHVSRAQIPLRLSWSITSHKVQGSSLDCALVDLGTSNFEFGQAYVSLSRVRSIDALYVHDFNPTVFRAHPKVVEFYKTIALQKMDMEMDWIAWIKDVSPKESIMVEDSVLKNNIVVIKEEEEEKKEEVNWLYDTIPIGWKECFTSKKDKLLELSILLSTKTFLPPREHIWSALEYTSLSSIKVVILGQDPYPTPGNAHGLAFSILPTVKPIPASLKNIYKELVADIGGTVPTHGYLESWAKQGVLLLNTVLTVEAGAPQSHSKIGWEEITDQIISKVSEQDVIFVLWGKSAQLKKKLLGKHKIFESVHPSPLSASRGFFGSKPFSTVNKWLQEMGHTPINWFPTI
jgi:ATP-dependent DNA helicase PIF1